jgi:hypothetical protein
MSYLHCPRCRLAIRCRAGFLTMGHCPRCLAHAGIATTLFASPLNAYELHVARADRPERARHRRPAAGDSSTGSTRLSR